MKSLPGNTYLLLLARLVVGVVFICASIEKIASPEAFAVSVEAYRLLPLPMINIFALFVPWLELLCGIFLVGGYLLRGSSLLASLLLCLFIFAIVSAMARQLDIDCGCFGAAYRAPVSWTRVAEDFGLMVLTVYLFNYSSPNPAPAGSPAAPDRS